MHSNYIVGAATALISANWFLEGKYKNKFEILMSRKSIFIFVGIFVVHIIGLFYTSDFEYALKDLKIKLPLFALPIIIGTSPKLSKKETKLILYLFILSIFVKTIIGFILFLEDKITDSSQLAGNYSHIRYSLLINIAIISAIYFSLVKPLKEKNKYIKISLIVITLWLSAFIFILKSLTGIIVFIFILIYFIYKFSRSEKKLLAFIFPSIAFLSILIYGIFSVSKYSKTDKIDFSKLEKFSPQKNKYEHYIERKSRENGHFVAIYICKPELENEWNKRSKIKFNQNDNLNQKISSTLIRYLSSKNLRKDSLGVSKLTNQDVKNIENGLTNYIFENKWSLYNKIYVALWETENYRNGGSPQNHSITQRFEFLRIASYIIKDNFLIGIGTGDLKIEFADAYNKHNSKLTGKNRLRAHNQYVTFFLTFGILGFSLIFFSMFYAPFFEKKYTDFLFLAIFIVLLLSMFNEDTLETQIGATMFALFYSLSVFGIENEIAEIE
jgi:hypothetical protein